MELLTHLQATRTELEKHYTHVTFVKHDSTFKHSVWTVGEDMETVHIREGEELSELAGKIECIAIRNTMKSIPEAARIKLDYFKQCISRELIKADRTLYKNYTAEQLSDMLLTERDAVERVF